MGLSIPRSSESPRHPTAGCTTPSATSHDRASRPLTQSAGYICAGVFLRERATRGGVMSYLINPANQIHVVQAWYQGQYAQGTTTAIQATLRHGGAALKEARHLIALPPIPLQSDNELDHR